MISSKKEPAEYKAIIAVPAQARTETEILKHIREAVAKSYRTHPGQFRKNFAGISVLVLNRYDLYDKGQAVYTLEKDYSLKEILNRKQGEDKQLHIQAVIGNFAFSGIRPFELQLLIDLTRRNNPGEIEKWENRRVRTAFEDFQEAAHAQQTPLLRTFIQEKVQTSALMTDTCWMCLFGPHTEVLKEVVRTVLQLPDLDIDSVLEEGEVTYKMLAERSAYIKLQEALEPLQSEECTEGRLLEAVRLMPQTKKATHLVGKSLEAVNRKFASRGLPALDLGYPRLAGCIIPEQPDHGFEKDTLLVIAFYSDPHHRDTLVTNFILSQEKNAVFPGPIEGLLINLAADADGHIREVLEDLEERNPGKIRTPVLKEALLDMQNIKAGGKSSQQLLEQAGLTSSGKAEVIHVFEGEDPAEKVAEALADRIPDFKA